MSLLTRLFPYFWPSRRRMFASFFFAGLVAILWGGNLSVVFPVVTVLMEKKGLDEYVQQKINDWRTEVSFQRSELAKIEAVLKKPQEDHAEVRLLRKKATTVTKLSSGSRQLAVWSFLELYIVRYLPKDNFDVLALIFGLLLVMTFAKLACALAEDMLVGSVAQLTVMRLRSHCLREVLKLDYQTLSRLGTPNLMSRFTYDLETLYQGLSLLGGKVIREPLKALVCVSLAMYVNWRLTLLSILFVPFGVLLFYRIGRWLKRASQYAMEAMGRIYKVLEETFELRKVVIAFDGARHHRRQHHQENKAYYEKSMRFIFFDAITNPVTEIFGITLVVLAVLPGTYLVLRNTESIWGIRLTSHPMDIAELSTLYVLLAGILDPVRKLGSVFSKLKRASAAADRVFELMELEPGVVDPVKPKPVPKTFESITFEDVCFTYASSGLARPAALEHVSLEFKAGEVVAVVGENGSGKSTLLNLLPRFFDAGQGTVSINGCDVRDLPLAELRRRIGVVTQETLLFDDTILENIRYGRRAATVAEVEKAGEQAHVTQFVQQLPDGFETRVGERGVSLSGGQRQRVALARAILRNPEILILDEATSAVDAQSEVLIHRTLQSFVKGRTTFIITHAVTPSVLDLLTRVVVMDHGRVAAVGTHEELLKTCPLYHRLCHARGARHAA